LAEQGETVIENCLILGCISTHIHPGNGLLIRNSVISGLFNKGNEQAGEGRLRLERSIAWNPQGENHSPGINYQSHPTQCKIRLTADRLLFEAGGYSGIFHGYTALFDAGSAESVNG
jgi:hypothetical protein